MTIPHRPLPPPRKGTFEWALTKMRDGKCVRRTSWRGKGNEYYQLSNGALRIVYGDGCQSIASSVPGTCIVAEDWEIHEPDRFLSFLNNTIDQCEKTLGGHYTSGDVAETLKNVRDEYTKQGANK